MQAWFSHMLSVKEHSHALFPKLKLGWRKTIKTKKTEGKGKDILTKDILSKANSNNDSVK